jgi:uncharacterized protein with FMN-binding domain
MERSTTLRSVSVLGLTAVATIPATGAWAATHSARAKPTATPTKTATKKYKGPVVYMRWGPVQVEIFVKGKKITNVKAGVAPDTERSAFIDEQALPILKQEVLKAQSADIDEVSGATLTSEAYIQSLQAVLKKAHLG